MNRFARKTLRNIRKVHRSCLTTGKPWLLEIAESTKDEYAEARIYEGVVVCRKKGSPGEVITRFSVAVAANSEMDAKNEIVRSAGALLVVGSGLELCVDGVIALFKAAS